MMTVEWAAPFWTPPFTSRTNRSTTNGSSDTIRGNECGLRGFRREEERRPEMIAFMIDMTPPTATAQQKGVFVLGGRAHFYTKAKVRDAENFLAAMLAPYRPPEPLEGPVYFQARWCYPYRKSEKRSVVATGKEIPHATRPDLDNLEKNLLDVMTRLQFWGDDAQVFTKSTAKVWGPKGYLAIAIKTEAELFNTTSQPTKGATE